MKIDILRSVPAEPVEQVLVASEAVTTVHRDGTFAIEGAQEAIPSVTGIKQFRDLKFHYSAEARRRNVLFARGQVLGGWAEVQIEKVRSWSANREFFLRRLQNNSLIAVTAKPVVTHGEVILVGGPAHVWWHWLIETLPTLHLMEKTFDLPDSIPIALPELVLRDTNKVEMLRRIVTKRPLVPLYSNTVHELCHAFVPAPVTSPGPTEFSLGSISPRGTFEKAAMGDFLEDMTNWISPRNVAPRGVFLARRNPKGRVSNQALYVAVAENFGLEILYTEDEPYTEVAEVISRSKLVVTTMGSGIANLAFATERPNVVVIGNSSWRYHTPFANLFGMCANKVFFFDDGAEEEPTKRESSFKSILKQATSDT